MLCSWILNSVVATYGPLSRSIPPQKQELVWRRAAKPVNTRGKSITYLSLYGLPVVSATEASAYTVMMVQQDGRNTVPRVQNTYQVMHLKRTIPSSNPIACRLSLDRVVL